MSRSYKKHPVCKDCNKGKKLSKRIANKRVRSKLKFDSDYISDGSSYRKIYESWNIADYVSRWTKEEAIKSYYEQLDINYYKSWHCCNPEERLNEFKNNYPTLDEFLHKCWSKYYRRK